MKSFKEYVMEANGAAIVPPSGNPIGPAQTNQQATKAPGNAKSIWPGQGAPVEVGMTVGLKGPNGLPVPGEIAQVDAGAKGVKVKNPTTGQEEWQNMDSLNPFMANANQSQTIQSGTQGVGEGYTVMPDMDTSKYTDLSYQGLEGPFRLKSGKVVYYDPKEGKYYDRDSDMFMSQDDYDSHAMSEDLVRLRELAGIKENCSAGATGAGAIAVAPAAMGNVKKRQPTDEKLTPEYTRTTPAKSIIGDTKPNQASGKLSADLSASGKQSAGRARRTK